MTKSLSDKQSVILVVDDQPEVLLLFRICLSPQKWTLLFASNGREVFSQLDRMTPDLVLLDIMLPGIDGFEICRRLKARSDTCDIPVMFITGLDDTANKLAGFDLGGIDYITKPFSPQEVLARINLHLTLRNLQQELQLSHARYQAIIEEQTELVCRYFPDGRLTFVNAAYCRAWGKPPEALLGHSLLSLFQRQIDLDFMTRLLRQERITTFEREVVLGDGTLQWQQWVVQPVRDSRGQIVEYQGVGRDITHLKRIEAELQRHREHLGELVSQRTKELERSNLQLRQEIAERQRIEGALKISEEQYRLLTEQVADGIGVMHDGLLLFCNLAWKSFFGLTAERFAHTPFLSLFHQEDRHAIENAIHRIQRGETVPAWQARCITADNRILWAEGHSTLISWQGQHAVLTTICDITDANRRKFALTQERNHLRQENVTLRATLQDRDQFGGITGKSPAMQAVYELIVKAAASDANVIIDGESGTGKELVARTIHRLSQRSAQAFVAVNCGAIPESLFEREFFGHRRGSFTGAMRNQPGYLDRARNGTLFLDEVGELTPIMQVKLLRVLQDGEYTPIGSAAPKTADVRIIAATNKDLKALLDKGVLREDFFYRIRVIVINLPPLRARKEDIPLLIDHFLEQYRKNNADMPAFPVRITELFCAHDWPGNVRELQNELQRYIAGQRLEFLDSRQVAMLAPNNFSELPFDVRGLNFREAVETFEKYLIHTTLKENAGHQGKTAEILGIPPRTLYEKIRRYQLKT